MSSELLGLDAAPVKRKRRWLRVLLITVLIIVLLAVAAAGSLLFYGQHKVNVLLTPKTAATRAAQKDLAPPLPGQPANILIMGSDHRPTDGGTAEQNSRSDTLLLLRLDPKHHTVSQLSFPRDLYVNIPGHGMDKINDAFTLGGPKLTVDTIKSLTNLPINYIDTVDFKEFKSLVTTFGGVYVQVDQRYFNDSDADGADPYSSINIQPGYQKLNGTNALAFARFRHTDDDFHRIARQQQVIDALKSQVSGTDVLENANGLFNTLNKNSDMATGGNGKVSASTFIGYIRLALSLSGKSVYRFEITGDSLMTSGGADVVSAPQSAINTAVHSFLYPSKEAQDQTANSLLGTSTKGAKATKATAAANAATGTAAQGTATTQAPATTAPTGPEPSSISVEVLNGNGIAGAATALGKTLSAAGYQVQVGGNADRLTYPATQVIYGTQSQLLAAREVSALLPGSQVIQQVTSAGQSLEVITGGTQAGGTSGTASTDGTQTTPFNADTVGGAATTSNLANNVAQTAKAPANVCPDTTLDSAYPALKGQTKSLAILVPTVVMCGSRWNTPNGQAAPVRAYTYKVGKRTIQNYVSYAHTAAQDYWGFQATSWKNPPIIASPTRSVTRKGRTYMLFFNGTALHMVAWHYAGGTYWVYNSVLDKLSNGAMLAIAEGVLPPKTK